MRGTMQGTMAAGEEAQRAPVVVQDGRCARDGRLSLSALDPGLTEGVGVFETLRVRGGEIIALERHLERFYAGVRALSLPGAPSEARIRFELGLAMGELGLPEAALRFTLTGGGTFWVRASPAPPPSGPLRVGTAPSLGAPLAHIKHLSRAPGRWARMAAGVDELIWRAPDGGLLEGTWSNTLALRAGTLWTAPLDGQILPGTTRAQLLEVARALGVPCVIAAPVGPFDELYCCSALRGLVPVGTLDGAPLRGWGPVGRALAAGLRARWPAGAEAGGAC